MSEVTSEATTRARRPLPISELDFALAAQLAVAWAGETGADEPRLKWWSSDLVNPDAGEDLFRRLMPSTWKWAVFQAVREAARRNDAARQAHVNDPDRVVTLIGLGFELDERIEERLMELKRTTPGPREALPALNDLVREGWNEEAFADWVRGQGQVDYEDDPAGRRIKGAPPESLEARVKALVAALAPLAKVYPRPHFRRTP